VEDIRAYAEGRLGRAEFLSRIDAQIDPSRALARWQDFNAGGGE
jgi:hypothetical protein